MQSGAWEDFVRRARVNAFRGILVAVIFLIVSMVSQLDFLLYTDWFVLPLVFYILALPYLWKRIRWLSLIPFFLWIPVSILSTFYLLPSTSLLWWPYHEEIGKWLQSLTNAFPGAMSPFVSIGFSFIENIRYFSYNSDFSYMIARSLFSLPLHLFATFIGLYCFLKFRSKLLWGFVGIVAAIALHAFYNWSLEASILVTVAILVAGYIFYGWSLENGWWKRRV